MGGARLDDAGRADAEKPWHGDGARTMLTA